MTTTEKQMLALLARRQEIDRKTDPGFTENHRWLIEAVELLLRHQVELVEELRKEMSDQLRKELCREISKEVYEELRNAGILL
jgi:hypothetical protein